MRKIHIRDERKGLLFLLALFIAFVAVIVRLVISMNRDAAPKAGEFDSNTVSRVLFVLDDGEGGAVCSGVFIFYFPTRNGILLNIPGNTGAIYKSIDRVDRIDAVYREKGVDVYRQEIESLIDCNIDFSLVVTLEDFMKFTDMLGGIRVFIPAPIDAVSGDGERWLLPSGGVTLDGDKISAYIRYRLDEETEADIQERYQNVMAGFFSMLGDRKRSVFSSRKIFRQYVSLLNLNTDPNTARDLLSAVAEIESETLVRQSVQGTVRVVDGKRLMFPLGNGDFIKETLRQATTLLMSRNRQFDRIYVLEIQNGTSVQGLAHNTAVLFRNASYDVLSAINADSNDYEKTLIIDHIGNQEAARLIGDFIRCSNIKEEIVDASDEEYESANVDFTIILGKDFDGRYVRGGVKNIRN